MPNLQYALTIHLPYVRRLMGGMKAPLILKSPKDLRAGLFQREYRVWTPPLSIVGDTREAGGITLVQKPFRLAIHASMKEVNVLTATEETELPKGKRGAVCAVATLAGWRFEPGLGYAWLLSDVVALREPVTCSGRQRLWQLPDAVDEAVRRQVAAVRR